jgi:hypothetical protein
MGIMERMNIFQGGECKSVTSLGSNIIYVAKHWYQLKGPDLLDKLHKVFPLNILSYYHHHCHCHYSHHHYYYYH